MPTIAKFVKGWFKANARSLPWRELWVQTHDPYVVWVSEVFLQQTQIKTVIPKYKEFISHFPTVDLLALASTEDLRPRVAGLGYYRRFNYLHLAAKQIFRLKLNPQSYVEWRELPGVGHYTASAVASICFEEKKAVLDGNVERVLCRLYNIQEAPNIPAVKKRLQSIVDLLIEDEKPGDFNQGMMELGQLICTPFSPKCEACPLQTKCESFRCNTQHLAPKPKLKKQNVVCRINVLVPYYKNHLGIIQRDTSSKFLTGTKGFYHFERNLKSDLDLKKLKKVGEIKHQITNHKITADIYLEDNQIKQSTYISNVEWVSVENLRSQLMTSFDSKVMNVIYSL